MKIKNINSILFVIIFSACSSTEKSNEEIDLQNKVYSDETNRAFEMIERGYGNGATKRYRPPPKPTIGPIDETIAYEPAAKILAPKTKAAPTKSKAKKNDNVSEKMIELNQNLAFYCMKHRNDIRFKNDEKKCMDYVGGILNQCQKKISAQAKLLTCVKKRLTLK